MFTHKFVNLLHINPLKHCPVYIILQPTGAFHLVPQAFIGLKVIDYFLAYNESASPQARSKLSQEWGVCKKNKGTAQVLTGTVAPGYIVIDMV